MKISINSSTSGNFEKRFLNNREHIVTDMVSIVGNSVMNRGFYPLQEVQNTFNQLHHLPAPNGHPHVGNELVSAFHPVATNAFNIGGFVRNPRMDGDKVVNEFWLDLEVANGSDDGQELVRRIENGDNVGVSTGLTLRQEAVNEDTHDWIARELNFDHVAILLNEKAAGEHVGTKLQNNSVMVCNCADAAPITINEGLTLDTIINKVKSTFGLEANAESDDDRHNNIRDALTLQFPSDDFWVWVVDVFTLDGFLIYEVEDRKTGTTTLYKRSFTVDDDGAVTLGGDQIEVEKHIEFLPVGDASANEDEESNMSTTDENGESMTVQNAIDLLETKGLSVVTKDEKVNLAFFAENRSKIESMLAKEEAEVVALRADVVANSELTDDDVAGMEVSSLKRLANSFDKPQNYGLSSGNGARATAENAEQDAEDFEDSYTTNHAEA